MELSHATDEWGRRCKQDFVKVLLSVFLGLLQYYGTWDTFVAGTRVMERACATSDDDEDHADDGDASSSGPRTSYTQKSVQSRAV